MQGTEASRQSGDRLESNGLKVTRTLTEDKTMVFVTHTFGSIQPAGSPSTQRSRSTKRKREEGESHGPDPARPRTMAEVEQDQQVRDSEAQPALNQQEADLRERSAAVVAGTYGCYRPGTNPYDNDQDDDEPDMPEVKIELKPDISSSELEQTPDSEKPESHRREEDDVSTDNSQRMERPAAGLRMDLLKLRSHLESLDEDWRTSNKEYQEARNWKRQVENEKAAVLDQITSLEKELRLQILKDKRARGK
jgi:hypothetical protein